MAAADTCHCLTMATRTVSQCTRNQYQVSAAKRQQDRCLLLTTAASAHDAVCYLFWFEFFLPYNNMPRILRGFICVVFINECGKSARIVVLI